MDTAEGNSPFSIFLYFKTKKTLCSILIKENNKNGQFLTDARLAVRRVCDWCTRTLGWGLSHRHRSLIGTIGLCLFRLPYSDENVIGAPGHSAAWLLLKPLEFDWCARAQRCLDCLTATGMWFVFQHTSLLRKSYKEWLVGPWNRAACDVDKHARPLSFIVSSWKGLSPWIKVLLYKLTILAA